MASAIIHLAVAKELEKKLNIINKYDYYLGSIAPDLAKQIGESKEKSHFIQGYKPNVPNLNLFKAKYPYFESSDFTLGYYTHLVTDKEWFERFLPNVTYNDFIHLLDGTIIKLKPQEIQDLIYSDYTNLNVQLIDEYELDLSLFYEDFKEPRISFQEIPLDKLDILINKMGILIANSKDEKTYSLDITKIKQFIENTANKIEKELEVI